VPPAPDARHSFDQRMTEVSAIESSRVSPVTIGGLTSHQLWLALSGGTQLFRMYLSLWRDFLLDPRSDLPCLGIQSIEGGDPPAWHFRATPAAPFRLPASAGLKLSPFVPFTCPYWALRLRASGLSLPLSTAPPPGYPSCHIGGAAGDTLIVATGRGENVCIRLPAKTVDIVDVGPGTGSRHADADGTRSRSWWANAFHRVDLDPGSRSASVNGNRSR